MVRERWLLRIEILLFISSSFVVARRDSFFPLWFFLLSFHRDLKDFWCLGVLMEGESRSYGLILRLLLLIHVSASTLLGRWRLGENGGMFSCRLRSFGTW